MMVMMMSCLLSIPRFVARVREVWPRERLRSAPSQAKRRQQALRQAACAVPGSLLFQAQVASPDADFFLPHLCFHFDS